jgi:UDPglucose--hexose-1-phosphate uridylyltransferase
MQFNISDHPHRRKNPLTGSWVLVSPHRAKRPWSGQIEKTQSEDKPEHDPGCYLCPGNTRAGGIQNPDYKSVYTFVNDFSALLSDTPSGGNDDFFFKAESVKGLCKVIIFSPSHRLTIPQMKIEDLIDVGNLWKKEYLELADNKDINYIQIFENKGAMMGCSNPHPHGQIWATESIPEEILKKCSTQEKYFADNRRFMLIDYIEMELKKDERIIYSNDAFAVCVPFWAVWPFETMIVPRKPLSSLIDFSGKDIELLMDAIKYITVKYDNLFEISFPYSAGMHNIPADGKDHPGFIWHMMFYPPLLRSATVKKFMVGYELLAEPQRDITPETSAVKLKELPDIHYTNR